MHIGTPTIIRHKTSPDGSTHAVVINFWIGNSVEDSVFQVYQANPENGMTAMLDSQPGSKRWCIQQFDRHGKWSV